MPPFSWAILILVLAFFVFVGVRFRKTKLLSNFPYQPDEKKLFEERPIKIEQGSDQSTTSIGMTSGGGVAVTSRGPRKTRIMRPWVQVTNKHIIIVQKKEEKPDGPIYAVLSFASVENPKLSWWKQGYITIPINVSEIRSIANEDGSYIIEIPLPSLIPIQGMENVQQIARIWTNQLSQYEKAFNTKIALKAN